MTTLRDEPPAARVPAPSAEADHPAGLQVIRIEIEGTVFAFLTYEVSGGTMPATLSDAERAVMRAVLEGKTNARIAAERKTATRTVANQVASLFHKLGVRSRAELAARFGVQR